MVKPSVAEINNTFDRIDDDHKHMGYSLDLLVAMTCDELGCDPSEVVEAWHDKIRRDYHITPEERE